MHPGDEVTLQGVTLYKNCCQQEEKKIKKMQSCLLKPRPNDRNISTQHIATSLAQHLQTPAKRSQHFSKTYRNIVTRVWPPCCNVLRHVEYRKSNYRACPGATLLQEPGRTTTTSSNIEKCCMKNLTSFKFEPTTPDMSQHFATHRSRVAKRM